MPFHLGWFKNVRVGEAGKRCIFPHPSIIYFIGTGCFPENREGPRGHRPFADKFLRSLIRSWLSRRWWGKETRRPGSASASLSLPLRASVSLHWGLSDPATLVPCYETIGPLFQEVSVVGKTRCGVWLAETLPDWKRLRRHADPTYLDWILV